MYAKAAFVRVPPAMMVSGVSGWPRDALRVPIAFTFTTCPFSIVAKARPCTCSRRIARWISGSDSDCMGRSGRAQPAANIAATPIVNHVANRMRSPQTRRMPHRAAPQPDMMP